MHSIAKILLSQYSDPPFYDFYDITFFVTKDKERERGEREGMRIKIEEERKRGGPPSITPDKPP